jgi:hypothetical protein
MEKGKIVNGVLYLPEGKPDGYKEQEITTRKFRKKRAKQIIKNKKMKNFLK